MIYENMMSPDYSLVAGMPYRGIKGKPQETSMHQFSPGTYWKKGPARYNDSLSLNALGPYNEADMA
jgi:hypothetical protein